MDEYKQISLLGRGHFGAAYLCEKIADKTKCAIKMVDLTGLPPEEIKFAKREVDVLKELHHPNIVKYVDSFEDSGSLCIVMEYCEDGTLLKKIEEQQGTPFSEDKIWDWFIQLCMALKYLHGRRSMHRDIKSDNVLVTKDGSLRLGDFGLAKMCQYTGMLAHTSGRTGALAFSAPEMIAGMDYTSKCDIWSLGCLLYNLAALDIPFIGTNIAHLLMVVVTGIYQPIPGHVSSEMKQTIERLLTKDPGERPTISQILDMDFIKARAQPQQRLKSVYGFTIADGVLVDGLGNGFKWGRFANARDNNSRFEGIAEIFEHYVYGQMLAIGLTQLPVPLRDRVDPDYDSPGSFIFATENWRDCDRLVILIHGSGHVKAGQWTRRVMIKESVDKGTQLPYIKRAVDCGYGVIVLNTNDTRHDIEGCKSPVDHGIYVWRHYITKCKAKKIAIKAHSAGGAITVHLLTKFEEDFRKRVYANAFTGVSELVFGNTAKDYITQVTRNWITSSQPVGTILPTNGCECVSAGTDEHEKTPHNAYDGVFDFIEQRFKDSTPGNL